MKYFIDVRGAGACEAGEFRCENGPCIPGAYQCDGKVDCPNDNSDELDCSKSKMNVKLTLNQITTINCLYIKA